MRCCTGGRGRSQHHPNNKGTWHATPRAHTVRPQWRLHSTSARTARGSPTELAATRAGRQLVGVAPAGHNQAWRITRSAAPGPPARQRAALATNVLGVDIFLHCWAAHATTDRQAGGRTDRNAVWPPTGGGAVQPLPQRSGACCHLPRTESKGSPRMSSRLFHSAMTAVRELGSDVFPARLSVRHKARMRRRAGLVQGKFRCPVFQFWREPFPQPVGTGNVLDNCGPSLGPDARVRAPRFVCRTSTPVEGKGQELTLADLSLDLRTTPHAGRSTFSGRRGPDAAVGGVRDPLPHSLPRSGCARTPAPKSLRAPYKRQQKRPPAPPAARPNERRGILDVRGHNIVVV